MATIAQPPEPKECPIRPSTPPAVWSWNKESGACFANIMHRPIAGPTHDKDSLVGRHPLQLYSLATPNGMKVTIMPEELLAVRLRRAEYYLADPDRRRSVRVGLRREPLVPRFRADGPQRVRDPVFESGLSRCTWPKSSGPSCRPRPGHGRMPALPGRWARLALYLGGGFRHFYACGLMRRSTTSSTGSPWKAKRQLDVDRRLADSALPGRRRLHDRRHGGLALVWRPGQGRLFADWANSAGAGPRANLQRWTDAIATRPAVRRGRMVNRAWGEPSSQLHERHDASDFETRRRRLQPGQAAGRRSADRRKRLQRLAGPCRTSRSWSSAP